MFPVPPKTASRLGVTLPLDADVDTFSSFPAARYKCVMRFALNWVRTLDGLLLLAALWGQPPDGLTTPTKQLWNAPTEHINTHYGHLQA